MKSETSLARRTSFKIGGTARSFHEPENPEELGRVLTHPGWKTALRTPLEKLDEELAELNNPLRAVTGKSLLELLGISE